MTHTKCIRDFGQIPEGRRPVGSGRHKRKENTTTNLKEIRLVNVDWIHVVQNMDQGEVPTKRVINLQFPQNKGNFLNSSVMTGFSMTLCHGVSHHYKLTMVSTPPISKYLEITLSQITQTSFENIKKSTWHWKVRVTFFAICIHSNEIYTVAALIVYWCIGVSSTCFGP